MLWDYQGRGVCAAMNQSLIQKRRLSDATRRHRLAGFVRNEDGDIMIFGMFLFLSMMVLGGFALDLMNTELNRSRMQSTVDRAVLAAADLDQQVDPKAVVDDYMAKAGMANLDYTVNVVETKVGQAVTSRRVDADVVADIPTFLTHLAGFDHFGTAAGGAALEAVGNIEISLVLDVSGSMRNSNNNKLSNLQTAATDFVDDIFENDANNKASMSIIPYATQVSAGETLLSYYNATSEHNDSHCVNFDAAAFDTPKLSHTAELKRTMHFDPWRDWDRSADPRDFVCRNDGVFYIQPFSNNVDALKAQINALTADGNTSIEIGVKWGLALLDPDTDDVVSSMIDDELLIDAFEGRPLEYDDDVLKVIVVMTDGVNTTQYYIDDDYRSGLSNIYKRPSNGRFSMEDEEWRDWDRDGDWWEEYWYADAPNARYGGYWIDDPYGGNSAEQLTWAEVWEEMQVDYWAYWMYKDRYNDWDDYYDARDAARHSIESDTKDTRLGKICTQAKNNDVVIFSIGFEVTDDSALVMESCASTPNHFYRVTGNDISYAFASIANQVNQLKLVE